MADDSIPTASDSGSVFRGSKHARFHDPETVYHVLLRTFQGRFLLRPDRRDVLSNIVAGVIGRAQERWPSVRLYAHSWLSNHAHLLVQGEPGELPGFIAYVQREISRRWGSVVGWSGCMFERYESTALPAPESELRAFRYVLAQGTKEHLVDSPLKWPGVHCAKHLVESTSLKGKWFDGTRYGKARHAQLASVHPKPVDKRDFETSYRVELSRLPACREMSEDEYRSFVRALVAEIERDAAQERLRSGRKVSGPRRVLSMPRERRSKLPPQPWYEKRRRMIFWADRLLANTQDYLRRYWEFQHRFREASRRFCAGEIDTPFPPAAFRPSVFVS